MFKDGLYICHLPKGHALVLISQNNGESIWMREFANVEAALNVLEDDVLERYDRSQIEVEIKTKRSYFAADIIEPEDGYGYFMMTYKRERRS